MLKNKTVRNVFFLVFCLFACVSLGYAESCSSKGQVQYKYTASGCSYTTQTRTCCSNGSWSDWGGTCPNPGSACAGNQCWDGSKCVTTPMATKHYNGKCYYKWKSCYCVNGSGWNCSGKEYEPNVTVRGSFTGGASATSSNCQYRTNNAYNKGVRDADSLCVTQKSAIGCSGTCTFNAVCKLPDGTPLHCEAKLVECE